MSLVPVRMGLQQRVLPEYRAPLFELLADSCPQGLGVFAGPARPEESIATFTQLEHAVYFPAKNIHLLRGSLYALLQPTFRSWLEIWDPEALIIEANPRYLSTPTAIRWMHQHHHPVIGWGLGAPAARGPEANLRRRFLQSLDAVVAYSHTGAEQYAAAGITPERIFVAPNAVAPRPAHGPVKRPAQFREGQPTVLFIGRLQARKRLDELIAACAALPGTLQPRLVLVGDGPEREPLQLLARQIYPETIFTGAKHGIELEPYFAEADLFALPGTGGLAVQQAMAHSLPVLVGEADGTQSELVRPENGWLLPDGSRNTLIQTLRQALSSAARLREMGEASYRIVDQEVNLEKMVEVFCNAVNFALRT